MSNKTITVKTDEENPEPVEIIADAIIKISEAFDKMKQSRLTERAILLLIHDNCGYVGNRFKTQKPSTKVIKEVLDSIAELRKAYIKPPVKK